MTVRFVFKGDVSAADLDTAIFPGGGGLNIAASAGSPALDRHQLWVERSGDNTAVYVDGAGKSELSPETEQNVIDAVPTDHIRTEDV